MQGNRALRRETDSGNEAAGVVRKSLPVKQQNVYDEAADCASASTDR